jgi:hypothetical protein
MGAGGSFPGLKLTTHLHLVTTRIVELYLHSPISLLDMVLNLLSIETLPYLYVET